MFNDRAPHKPDLPPGPRLVWQRYRVTSMTLHRWQHDGRHNFPQPIYIGRMRFWRVADLEAWEAEQAHRAEKVA